LLKGEKSFLHPQWGGPKDKKDSHQKICTLTPIIKTKGTEKGEPGKEGGKSRCDSRRKSPDRSKTTARKSKILPINHTKSSV